MDDTEIDSGPREECGVFGVWAPGEDVAKLTYYGLYALQHRGQEAAGIAVSDGRRTVVFKDLGLVSQVFDEQVLSSLRGHLAVGHVRYSTTGSTTWENAQPTFRTTATGSGIALGHNGNLVNTAELRDEVTTLRNGAGNGRNGMQASTDSDLVCELLAGSAADIGVEESAMRLLPRLRGAFSLAFADEQTLYAARDPHGVRPLVLGRLERGWVVASETAALDIVGASMVREVEPGELLAIDADGIRSSRFAAPEPKGCVFEYVYLARPDTAISGRSVHAARVEIGRLLARGGAGGGGPGDPHAGVGHPRGDRLRTGLGHPVRPGPGEERLRRAHVHPAEPDHPPARASGSSSTRCATSSGASAWSSSTTRSCAATPSARWSACCARRARWRCTCGSPRRRCAGRASTASTSPPARSWSPAALDAEGVRRSIGADTLGYVSLDGLIAATEQPRSRLCSACFDGDYPIPLPEEARLGKYLLEGVVPR